MVERLGGLRIFFIEFRKYFFSQLVQMKNMFRTMNQIVSRYNKESKNENNRKPLTKLYATT